MVILVDTNIIIDALANREPYADDAKRIMEKCAAREITGILAAHSIPNLFYILRKNFSQEERRFLLKNLCEIFQISDLNEKKIVAALENNVFSDFEDGLQEECAVESMADYIVTRNPADFKHSRVKVILPDELLRELEKKLIIRSRFVKGIFRIAIRLCKNRGVSTPLGCIVLPAEEGNRPPSESARLPQAVAPPTFEW